MFIKKLEKLRQFSKFFKLQSMASLIRKRERERDTCERERERERERPAREREWGEGQRDI